MNAGISVVIPTRDRLHDLCDLLETLLYQSQMPLEIIIVDDSPKYSPREVADSFVPKFQSLGCKLRYIIGNCDGLTASRNIGVTLFEGDSIFFLDDDTLLDRNVLNVITAFFKDNPRALGIQPLIVPNSQKVNQVREKPRDAVNKAFMLNYQRKNTQKVRRSGASIFPSSLTKVIKVKRFSGCCCYKRQVFHKFIFDTNLKRWGFMEDLDFSYRVYKKYPQSLYITPHAKIIHKTSKKARLPNETSVHMVTTYWFYVFFKDVFDSSIQNLLAFLWGLCGYLIVAVGGLIVNRKPKQEWWSLIYLLKSYVTAFKNLRSILMKQLDFFNKQLK